MEGRKAEKDRFLHVFPAFLPSKESVLRSVSGNRISTEFRTRHPMGERDSSRKILAFNPLPPFLCLHPRIQDYLRKNARQADAREMEFKNS